ncbi:hypothetical protein BH24BAC1_BH24BAC1_37310 [soil metagenome]
MTASKKKKFLVHYLPIYGCFSTGLIYVAIGVIAILSFLRIKDGGADETSLLAYLNGYLAGKALIVIILLGTLSYIVWRIYETVKDPYEYGREATGMAKRTGIALSTVADAFIAYAAIEVLFGISNIAENGQPDELREVVRQMLRENWGTWLVIGIGAVILVTAVVQFVYGITKGYGERLAIRHFSSGTKSLIHFLAWYGYAARGIILGIIGFFFIKAGVVENARYVVNTDKAFDFIGDHVGHVYFILVAVGTICYGLFMFALGVTYEPEKRKASTPSSA